MNPYGDGNNFAHYWCLDPSEEIRTVQQIYDAHTDQLLIQNDTANYTADQKHFWNLSTRTSRGYYAEDLYVIEKIYVEDENTRKAMLDALRADPDLEVLEEEAVGDVIAVKFTHGDTSAHNWQELMEELSK